MGQRNGELVVRGPRDVHHPLTNLEGHPEVATEGMKCQALCHKPQVHKCTDVHT